MRYLRNLFGVSALFKYFCRIICDDIDANCRINDIIRMMYIHERDNWTDFRWDTSKVELLQEEVFRKQGLLYGRLASLGFDSKIHAMAENLTYDIVYSSEVEASASMWIRSVLP